MSVITVKSEHQYDIHICDDWLKTLTENITDYSRIAIFYPQSLKENIPQISIDSEVHYFPLPEGEAAKSIKTLATMWDWMGAAGFTRSDLVVAIGGGTITDVAGFLSATWLRGIDWIAVPTTLAGMVDASVGGKNHDVAESRLKSAVKVGKALQVEHVHFINEETTAVYGFVNSDVFKDFPNLKIIMSHGGGAATRLG
jgi:3-dehydroquinate synthetase